MTGPWRGALAALGLCVCLGLAGRLSGAYAPDPAEPQHRLAAALPADRPIRIVALGTSLTRRSGWPDRLAEQLTACAGRSVTVTPIAKVGANSRWGLAQAGRVIAEKPDLVLIEFAVNDADLLDGQSRARSRANHRALVDQLTASLPGIRLVLMTTNPADGARGLVRPWLAAYNADYRRLAADRDLGLIDLAPVWTAALATGRSRALLPDGLHPTEAAVESVALPVIAAELGKLVPGCDQPAGTKQISQ